MSTNLWETKVPETQIVAKQICVQRTAMEWSGVKRERTKIHSSDMVPNVLDSTLDATSESQTICVPCMLPYSDGNEKSLDKTNTNTPTEEQEKILLEHLPIVRYLARRIHERLPQHVEIDDLISAGVVGLMDAFTKYDPAKKVQFRSYAQFRIRGAILDSLRMLDWSPRDLRRKGRAVEEAIRVQTAKLGRPPSETEIAIELNIQLSEYHQLLGELKGLEIGTLHVERSEDSGDEELAYIPGRPEDDPLFHCLRGEMEDRLTGAITRLPERERLVMTLYYYEEMTMKEIGLALGVVESRVSQIHASAVLHLRAILADIGARGGGKRVRVARRGNSNKNQQESEEK